MEHLVNRVLFFEAYYCCLLPSISNKYMQQKSPTLICCRDPSELIPPPPCITPNPHMAYEIDSYLNCL